MSEEWVVVVQLQHSSLNQSALDVVVFKYDVFTQHFDGVILRRSFHFGQQHLSPRDHTHTHTLINIMSINSHAQHLCLIFMIP